MTILLTSQLIQFVSANLNKVRNSSRKGLEWATTCRARRRKVIDIVWPARSSYCGTLRCVQYFQERLPECAGRNHCVINVRQNSAPILSDAARVFTLCGTASIFNSLGHCPGPDVQAARHRKLS